MAIAADKHWLDYATFIVTAVGVSAAIWGGVIALRQFIESTRTASHAHMHQMFCRYLEARREMDEAPKSRFKDRVAVAIYFLEEVYAWTTSEQALLRRPLMQLLIGTREMERRLDIIKSWQATVEYQICRNPVAIAESLIHYPSCYGASFLMFAQRVLKIEIAIYESDRPNPFQRSRGRGKFETWVRDAALRKLATADLTGTAEPTSR